MRQHVVENVGRFVARVDFAYPDPRLAIELDGFRSHGQRKTFDQDRTRQNQLVLLGWTVLRFTWSDLTDRGDSVAATLGAALVQ